MRSQRRCQMSLELVWRSQSCDRGSMGPPPGCRVTFGDAGGVGRLVGSALMWLVPERGQARPFGGPSIGGTSERRKCLMSP